MYRNDREQAIEISPNSPKKEIHDTVNAEKYIKQGLRYEKKNEWVNALKCYEKAAQLGSVRAYTNQATLYLNGLGVQVNTPKAFELFLRGAELGHARAQYNVGMMLEKGEGTAQDLEQALVWYEKAAAQENTEAKQSYQRLLKKLKLSRIKPEEKTTLVYSNPHLQNSVQVINYGDLTFGKRIAAGEFGEVFIGQWQQGEIAIKKLFTNKFDRNLETEFISEVSILYRLNSPRVVRLYGITLEPTYCMVMEYAALGSLQDYLKKNKVIDWPTKIQIGCDVVAGIEYLHSKSILHCDLKSANVLIDHSVRAKLSDFGLAKLKSGDNTTEINVNTQVLGSAKWMPPEVIFAKGKVKFTQKVDIYSCGMVLWEIASSKLPLANYSTQQLSELLKVAHREKIPEEVPAALKKAILKCWNEEPEKRPTAQAIVKKLINVQLKLTDEKNFSPSMKPETSNENDETISGYLSLDYMLNNASSEMELGLSSGEQLESDTTQNEFYTSNTGHSTLILNTTELLERPDEPGYQRFAEKTSASNYSYSKGQSFFGNSPTQKMNRSPNTNTPPVAPKEDPFYLLKELKKELQGLKEDMPQKINILSNLESKIEQIEKSLQINQSFLETYNN